MISIWQTKVHIFCLLFHDLWGISLSKLDEADLLEPCECCGVVVITTTQLHSSKPELRFCTGSNPACGMSEIHHGKNLTVTLAGNKAKWPVNHTTKTNNHLLLASAPMPLLPCKYETNRNNNIFSSMAILHYLAPSITYYIYIVLNKPQTKS